MKFLSIILILGLSFSSFGSDLKIYAASNFFVVLDKIKKEYQSEYPNRKITIIYGSSGKGYHQIINGAPYDIFLSADVNYLKILKEKGFGVGEIKEFLGGKLSLWTRKDLGIKITGINSLLNPKIEKIAVANPETAPYGKAAVECLKKKKIYNLVKSKLVKGDSVSKTAQLVQVGAADVGIIAYSIILGTNMKNTGVFKLIDQNCYSPIKHGYLILNKKNYDRSIHFLKYLLSDKSKMIFVKYGYEVF